MTNDNRGVKQCADLLLDLIKERSDDDPEWGAEFGRRLAPLLERPDLLTIGVDRTANHAPWASYLYFDTDLSIHVNYIPSGRAFPVHDHGIWEAIGLYRGSVRHTSYECIEESPAIGRATLEVKSVSELELGGVEFAIPPHDIHSLEALSDDTYIVTVHLNAFKKERRYFQPEQGTYVLRDQTVWRRSQ